MIIMSHDEVLGKAHVGTVALAVGSGTNNLPNRNKRRVQVCLRERTSGRLFAVSLMLFGWIRVHIGCGLSLASFVKCFD